MKYLFTILTFCSVLNLSASKKPFSATILDSKTNEPLPFTNIVVAGQNKGTISNIEGHFVLNMENITPNDTILFSYMGYETLKMRAAELQNHTKIYMHPATINLSEIQVSSKSLTAEEIIALIHKNYPKNYPNPSYKQHIFFHKYEKTPFPEKNKIILKNSNFIGMSDDTFHELFQTMPDEFIEYQDVLIELYNHNENHKLIPIEGISLEEGSQKTLTKQIENKLGAFFDDIKKSANDANIYYKFRSGILSHKFGENSINDSIWNEYKNDTLNYTVKTEQVKSDILLLFKNYTNIQSKNWEFINNRNKYNYSIKGVTIFNDELVHQISFTPKKRGLFEGVMYISATTYAILQLDFAFAENKQSEKFQFLGFGHSINFKKGRVIFEKGKNGYFLKYIYAQQHESVSIERNFSIIKKKKRFLINKELNEIKLKTQLFFDITSYREILVIDRKEIDSLQFEKTKQPQIMKLRKKYTYSPEMWNNRTVIAPTSELKKYKRK